MTEQVQGFSADQGQSAPSESQNVQSSAPAQAVQQERMLPQSEVNKIVGRIKDESYQKGLQDAGNRAQQPVTPNYEYQAPVMQQSHQSVQQIGGISQQSPEQIRAMIAEEQQKLEQAKYFNGLANSFVSKVEAGKSKYEDFDNVVKDLNLPQIPVIWQTAEKFDNPADILYHLRKNPGKLSQLLTVAYSPELVKSGMQEISDSLKQNEVAAQQKKPNAPLSRPQPSNVGMGNGDKNMTAQDWKKIQRV